ncbi:MAG: hypothetical protein GC136_04375 [Alphaproteobacteria bacterium]|nr:hypothetical protein [Alphaproteobacteria bacterium]
MVLLKKRYVHPGGYGNTGRFDDCGLDEHLAEACIAAIKETFRGEWEVFKERSRYSNALPDPLKSSTREYVQEKMSAREATSTLLYVTDDYSYDNEVAGKIILESGFFSDAERRKDFCSLTEIDNLSFPDDIQDAIDDLYDDLNELGYLVTHSDRALKEIFQHLPPETAGLAIFLELAQGKPLLPDVFRQPLAFYLTQNGGTDLVCRVIELAKMSKGQRQYRYQSDEALIEHINDLQDHLKQVVFVQLGMIDRENLPEEIFKDFLYAHANAPVAGFRERYNLDSPMLKSLKNFHEQKQKYLLQMIDQDPDSALAQRYLQAMQNWPEMAEVEKEAFLNQHLAMLSNLYGTKFCPEMSIVDVVDEKAKNDFLGQQAPAETDDEKVENALGKIKIKRSALPNFVDSLAIVTHEFIHGFEDWMSYRQDKDFLRGISKEARMLFPRIKAGSWQEATALSITFNGGDDYYESEEGSTRCERQFRERHAGFVEDLYGSQFSARLAVIQGNAQQKNLEQAFVLKVA